MPSQTQFDVNRTGFGDPRIVERADELLPDKFAQRDPDPLGQQIAPLLGAVVSMNEDAFS